MRTLLATLAFLLVTSTAWAAPKVEICHVPPGNAEISFTITISSNAVDAHLANNLGDTVGACQVTEVCIEGVVLESASTLDCPAGGTKITVCQSGVETFGFACSGLDGADGADGATGATGATGPTGTDGADGITPTVTPLAPGDSRCPNGGALITLSLPGFIFLFTPVCNGLDGTNGIDGANGFNGANGIDGTNGIDGVDGAPLTTVGSADPNICPAGGFLLSDGSELCHGVDGLDGANGFDGPAGATGATGATGQCVCDVFCHDEGVGCFADSDCCEGSCALADVGGTGVCVPPSLCGNEVVDSDFGEECDDGNNVDGDGCSADCLFDCLVVGASCPINSACCSGACEADICASASESPCTQPAVPNSLTCGDGISDILSGTSCQPTCVTGFAPSLTLPLSCSDGILTPFTFDCIPDPFCGDGNVDSGEQCDDGNASGGDGCSAACELETIFCGDGFIQPGEVCDGVDLGGETCATLGLSGGTLFCAGTCAVFDTTFCTPA